MPDFNPELYLRLLGEQELASGLDLKHEEINGRGLLSAAAAAFAATGVIDSALAETIVDNYQTADDVRLGHADRMRWLANQGSVAAASEALAPRHVYALNTAINRHHGTRLLIHSLTITDATAWLQVEMYSESQFSHGPGARPPALSIRTPAGRKLELNFHGSWGDHHAKGRFEIPDGGLAPDIGWLEIEAERVNLPEPVAPPAVELEHFDPVHLPIRYLWQLLASVGGRPGSPNVPGGAAALVAAGLIAEDDAELEALDWVCDTQDGRPMRRRHLRAGAPVPGSKIPEKVPPEWRSLLSGQRPTAGASGTLALAATTSAFDGISVAVNTLRSGAEGFSLDVETLGIGHVHPGMRTGFQVPLAWWAEDNLGHYYLGHINGWSSDDSHGAGEIEFGLLDSRASELTLMISALNARALIRVPLNWER